MIEGPLGKTSRMLWVAAVATACSGSDERAAATGSPADTSPACTDPACCAPLTWDLERSRAYLVDGRLAIQVVAQKPADRTEPFYFEVEVTSSAGTQTCHAEAATDSGLVFMECLALEVPQAACGAPFALELRMRATLYDPSVPAPLCGGVNFGPSLAWNPTVACPVCPTTPSQGAACDHPSISNCSVPLSAPDPFCGPISSLPCGCRFGNDGTRTWSCAIC